ncbi:MAG: type II toxin-antitoxin system Phd/YefM family antitoxin [Vulcanimicrobiaceae bacterium]
MKASLDSAVGIRDLKSHLSEYLKRVASGDRIVITDRGRPVAFLTPATSDTRLTRLDVMVASGRARWGGGKPSGSRKPARLSGGATLADTVIGDRR